MPSPDSSEQPLTSIPSQTPPSIQSVQLIGSWDNFSQSHPMQRDIRRGRDQWRGCYSFRDIVCDDVSVSASATCAGVGLDAGTSSSSGTRPSYPVKRHGGLKMGHTYYYYVRLPAVLVHAIRIALHIISQQNHSSPLRQTNQPKYSYILSSTLFYLTT